MQCMHEKIKYLDISNILHRYVISFVQLHHVRKNEVIVWILFF